MTRSYWVVNCLQNLLSLRSETTYGGKCCLANVLWIAYKIYYLCDRKQPCNLQHINLHCCELLTKFIIFAIGNNSFPRLRVMRLGCELLTKFIIFAIGNNIRRVFAHGRAVVNCLQNLLSLRSETTHFSFGISSSTLWIAYKIYYLCDRKQLTERLNATLTRCELLTKFIIFAIGNNADTFEAASVSVVNCLQNLLSLRSETTAKKTGIASTKLWIAYKIYYLCDRKQLLLFPALTFPSCELLTKFIIFAIGNNEQI